MQYRSLCVFFTVAILSVPSSPTHAATTVTCSIDHNNDNAVNILDVLYTLYCAVGVGPCVGEVLTCPEGVSCGADTVLTNNQCVVNCNPGGTCYDAAYAAGDTAGQATGFAAGQADITPGSGAYQAGYDDGLVAGIACALGDIPGVVTGSELVVENGTASYSIAELQGATSYTWSVPNGASIDDGQGGPNATISFADNGGQVCVSATNGCDTTNAVCMTVEIGAGLCDATGAVAYYPFEPVNLSGGTLANKSPSGDSLGTGADGAVCDDGFISQTAKIGSGSFHFDGDQDTITLSGGGNNQLISASGDFSIASWIYIDTVDQPHHYQILRLQNNPGQSGMEFLVADNWGGGKLALSWPNGYSGNPPMGNTKVPVNQWVHVAVTRSGNDIAFYLNGAADGGGTMTGGSPSADTPQIGGRKCNDGDESFDGLMDELSVWNRALNQTDIDCLYNSGEGQILQPCCVQCPDGATPDGQGGCVGSAVVFSDDFSTQKEGWKVANSGSGHTSWSGGKMINENTRTTTNESAMIDLGAPLDPNAWIIRKKVTRIAESGNQGRMFWSISPYDHTVSSKDTDKGYVIQFHDTNGLIAEETIAKQSSSGQSTGLTSTLDLNTPYYVETIYDGSKMTTTAYLDAGYTNKIGGTASSSTSSTSKLANLQYIGTRNPDWSNDGHSKTYEIDDLEVCSGHTSWANCLSATTPVSGGTCDSSLLAPGCTECNTAGGYASDGQGGCVYSPTPIFEDDLSSSNGWIQTGTGISISQETIAYDNAACGSDRRLEKEMGAALSDSEWMMHFDYKFTASNAPSHSIMTLTNTLGNPMGTNGMGLGVQHNAETGNKNDLCLTDKNGSAYYDCYNIPGYPGNSIDVQPNTQYYVTLKRTSATSAELSVFTDSERTQHVSNSPQKYTSLSNSIASLDTLQAAVNAGGNSIRKLTATLDNLQVWDGITTLTEPGSVITPTYTDDFSSDNWNDNNSTIGVDTGDQRLEYTIYRHSTNDGSSYDFGANVSDSAWVLRFKLVTQNINGGGSSHKMSWVGLSSADKGSSWGSSKDAIGFNHQISSSSAERDIHITYSDGQQYGSNQQNEFSTTLTNNQTHYYELARVSATSIKLTLYSDAAYSSEIESQTATIPSSISGLRYFVITNDTTYNIGGDFSGYIDDLEFYDGVGSLD